MRYRAIKTTRPALACLQAWAGLEALHRNAVQDAFENPQLIGGNQTSRLAPTKNFGPQRVLIGSPKEHPCANMAEVVPGFPGTRKIIGDSLGKFKASRGVWGWCWGVSLKNASSMRPAGFEPATKGFESPPRFHGARTISSSRAKCWLDAAGRALSCGGYRWGSLR